MSGREFNEQVRNFAQAANAAPEDIERVKESARHVTGEVLHTYVLQFIGPPPETSEWGYILPRINPPLLRETEENLTDLLPESYSVRIREWDEEETPNE